MSLPSIVLKTAALPCCGATFRLRALDDVPRETYDRECRCGTKWRIDRTLLRSTPEMRMNKLELEPVR